MEQQNINDFVAYCKSHLTFEERETSAYSSLSVCIIDCVYSLRARYKKTTLPVVERYAAKYMNGDRLGSGDKVTDLIKHIEDEGGPEAFAKNILKNNQKSGHILKAEVCLQLAKYFSYLKIETIDDFRNYEHSDFLEVVIRSVKGIGYAGTNYLFMLAGDPNRCKPDTHIHHFVHEACGEDLSDEDCQKLFSEAVKDLKKDYPNLTVAKLDGIIWREYQYKK